MQDIIPPKKRSIRDIPLPENKSRVVSDFENTEPREEVVVKRYKLEPELDDDYTAQEEVFETPSPKSQSRAHSPKPRSKKKIVFFSVLAVALIFVLFLVSREGAKVFVYAKETTQSTNLSLGLSYTPLELRSEKTVSVKATGEEQVTEKAKGRITIFNEYEDKEQRLLKETRFESPNGLIYRIPSSVVVPALTRDDKGNVIPGKLEVEVVADQPGEKYNIGAGKFTVPGFKDLPQYDSFYAISENPMEGGFDGVRKVISDSDRSQAETNLKNQLKDELIRLAKEKTSSENLVLADESMIVYEVLGDKVDGNNVSVSARGTIKAASFNFNEFSNSIAKSAIQISDNEDVLIQNIDKLNISISKIEGNRANVDVSGSIEFLWQNDHEELKKFLAGTKKTNIEDVVKNFPGIEKISAEVMPFWSGNLPEETEKIKIIDSKN